jgi:hypothetical protein
MQAEQFPSDATACHARSDPYEPGEGNHIVVPTIEETAMARSASKETTLGDIRYRLEAAVAKDGVTTWSISVSSTSELVGQLTAHQEHLAALGWALSEVSREVGLKTYTVEEAPHKHPTAYARWTAEEEAELVRRHAAGATVEKLAEVLGRKPSAIERRLERLGKLR